VTPTRRTGGDRRAESDAEEERTERGRVERVERGAVEEREGGGREERVERGEREARGPPDRTAGPLDR